MKKIISIGLIVLCTSAWADWTKVSTTVNDDVFYVDFSTKKTGQQTRIWIFAQYAKVSSETGVGSTKQLIEGDCAGGRLRVLTSIFFSDREGDRVDSVNDAPQNWSYPSPQSFNFTLFHILCGKDP